MLAVSDRLQKCKRLILQLKMWHPLLFGCDCLSTSCRQEMAKRFDPRAEFATAWPLEGRIQCDLRDRKQLMLLHFCPQSETWHLKKSERYLTCWIKLVGGPDAACGPKFGHPWCRLWKKAVTANTLVGVQHQPWTIVIQFPRHGHKLLSRNTVTASNSRPSTPYSRNTYQSFSRETRPYALSRSTKHV